MQIVNNILNELSEANKTLVSETDSSGIIWTGRAATALYIAYKTALTYIVRENPEVIVPSVSCATPANTALMAGINPRFADINLQTGLITLETIKERYTENTVAVVYIHLFGNVQDITDIKDWCLNKNLFLIEDNAHALGGFYSNGTNVGSFGDFSIYSFNTTKIIECGGGALTIKDKELAKIAVDIYSKISFSDIDETYKQTLALSYRNFHHSMVGLDRINKVSDISKFFLSIRKVYEPLYLRDFKEEKASLLAEEFKKLKENNKLRYEKANIYSTLLSNNIQITILEGWERSGVCWRFSFLLNNPENVITFSEELRKQGFHVSNLYWPVNFFFKPDDICKNAYFFARRVINLWVDKTVDLKTVEKCAQSILTQLER